MQNENNDNSSMIVDCALYRDGARVKQLTIDEISEALADADGGFVWLGLYEPSEQLLHVVKEEFGLHELAVEDAHSAHQRPKLEMYGDSLFMVLRTCQFVNNKIEFGETHIFVGKNYLVTVRHGASQAYSPVRARCESSPEQMCRGPGYVLYAVVDFVVDNYLPIVQNLEARLDEVDDDIFRGDTKQTSLKRIYDLKWQLMQLRKAVEPLLEVCGQLLNLRTPLIADEARPYFRDVLDHVRRASESIEIMRDMVNTALSVNVGLITIRQNEVVKSLAGWGALLAVPTLISSIYGMNFHHMPELEWKYGYPVVLGGIVLVCSLLYRKLRRAGWI
ncbi:MAG: magnesium/cobalt transporter CorA [Gammaproteobacteria bacterium]|nr:magnesium/cobalt transporter CorA [Gammaproteobacteria bacterium]